MTDEPLEVEASGETVGEAKWLALRELEKTQPGLDRSAVTFEILSEGERGILGVGTSPARVRARADAEALAAAGTAQDESELAVLVRGVVERIVHELDAYCRVDVAEDDETLTASILGGDLGLVIGKHGHTIDAIQYLVDSIVHRNFPDGWKPVIVDAAAYRERRRARLETLAIRSAERALATGEAIELEPMTAVERKLVHLRLKDVQGVETRSEGEEPNRYVVVAVTRD